MRFIMFFMFILPYVGCKTIPEGTEDFTPPIIQKNEESAAIAIIGDMGTGTEDQYKVGDAIWSWCMHHRCDYGLTVGDNFYPNGVESTTDDLWYSNFEKPYSLLNFKFHPTLGNHDYRGEVGAQLKYKSKRWDLPARYYLIRHKDLLDIFAIDTNVISKDERQVNWLKKSLKNSNSKWKIIYGHHPIYSSGMHGDTGYMKKIILPLMKKYRVDFYFAGHDHHQEIIQKHDLDFVIAGASGKLRDVEMEDGSIFAESTLGFSYLTVDSYEAKLYMIDSKGDVIYSRNYMKMPNHVRLK